ncbi:cytochrome c oxidase subunit II [Natronospirillum operosum]|uniref:cytochrome-c oxidase n=1 Tax=Natronospirillum operosum TaxID=2759953 RepID=A0A4Z0WBN7_9GAMM|nr:cytochrome c oxidase subunit II [Natronospirillum operosum]TGG95562.1 cytochrome c oxidase subunit II [Natronospirillum operosum]
MIIVIAIVLLVVGTVLFHFLSPWTFTPLASNWTAIDSTISITILITGIVFILVNLFMAYAIYKFRYRKDRKADYEPENKKLEIWLTGITAVGIAALLAPGLFAWSSFISKPDDAQTVEVLGKQWHWLYRFPGDDGVLGATDPRFVSPDNPFGLDPQDPAGQDDILVFSNILHLPVDQPMEMKMRAMDVLHNFGVPQFRAKMDMVPGMVTSMWLTPTRIGNFEVVCMQLCGMGHHAMRGRVVVQEQDDFQQWLDHQPTFAETLDEHHWGNPENGEALYQTCAGCHGTAGEGNPAMNAPKVSGLGQQYLIRQLEYYRDGVRGAHEDDSLGQQMAGMMATLPDEQAIRDVSAYIMTLPDQPAENTIVGDLRRGEQYYASCADCHGTSAEGNYYTRAPRLAGQLDSYLVRQIENFKSGVRGAHESDQYGMQMRLFAQRVQTEQQVNDLVAYINSLEPDSD